MDSGSALRVEKTTTLKPVVKKTYVLDTNVLLHDPTAVTAFKQHRVVIPMTVLEELEAVILEVDRERERVSLGLKQATANPWEDIEAKYAVGSRLRGKVVNAASTPGRTPSI